MSGVAVFECEVANFVMQKSIRSQLLHQVVIHLHLKVFVHSLNHTMFEQGREYGAILVHQAISGYMLYTQLQSLCHIVLPLLHGLVGQGIHQINGYIVEASCLRICHRLACLFGCVASADKG